MHFGAAALGNFPCVYKAKRMTTSPTTNQMNNGEGMFFFSRYQASALGRDRECRL